MTMEVEGRRVEKEDEGEGRVGRGEESRKK